MNGKVTIHCTNTNSYHEFPAGISLIDVRKKLKIKSPYTITVAKVNNKSESLCYRVYSNKTVSFVDNSEATGMRTYVRSLCFLFSKAISEVVPNGKLRIEHPVSLGYYCVIEGDIDIEEPVIEKIKEKMHEYIAADLPFEEVEEETENVVKLFRQHGYEDKALLLETSGSLYAKYYRLGDSVDYFYSSLVPSTGYLNLFDVVRYHGAWLLRIPNRDKPTELEPIIEQPQMLNVFKEQLQLSNIIGVSTIGEMNKANEEGHISTLIKISEAYQERTIAKIAEQITSRFKDGVRLVLISGPSSSGKTTFRMRVEVQLMVNLLKPVGISLDNYFVEREKTPKDEYGAYDFESLYALDLEQFNKDLNALLNGEKVSMPTFNFSTGKREYKGDELQIDENTILVIEGIHALNPELTAHIANNRKFKIYVSALTVLALDDHNWISTTDNRLIRRLIRDYQYRNYSAIDTISRWPSVRAGEGKWIFPYQENADAMFNSAMIYEFAALRQYAEPILMQVPNNVPEYSEANRLLKFLRYIKHINDSELPPTSLLREFLGGSSFRY